MRRIYQNGSGEIIEKKSRFIADVFDIADEADAMVRIQEVKKKYWDARHHCFAYVLGEKEGQQRFSDDGEPSGTAGKPILDLLAAGGYSNTLIVVTRYFGGTLLGTGGLIRAYQAAAKAGLAQSETVEVLEGLRADLEADYSQLGKIQHICADLGVFLLDTVYMQNVHLELLIPVETAQTFIEHITESFAGKVPVIQDGYRKFARTKEKVVLLP